MRRFVSIWLPRWPIDRLRRTARGTSAAPPEDAPFALTETGGNAVRLTAVNGAAALLGLHGGMMLTDARGMVPGLLTAPAEPEADARALKRLARWLSRYSPWTNVDGADGVLLDITGCAHLFGGEAKLLADMEGRLTGLGLEHRLGLADTAGAAHALARHGEARLAPPGGTAEALADLPVEGLRLDADTVTLLKRLGLKRIGQLYAFPRPALARRFRSPEKRAALMERLDRALGGMPDPLSPLLPVPDWRAGLTLAEPVQELETVSRIVARLAEDLCHTLKERGLGAQRFTLDLWRVDGTCARLAVGASRPAHDPAHVQRLFTERLEGLDAGFGIDRAVLGAARVARLSARQSSLAAEAEEAEDGADGAALARLIDRLAARFGEDAVVRLQPRDSHVPERAEQYFPVIPHSPVILGAHFSSCHPRGRRAPAKSRGTVEPEDLSQRAETPPRAHPQSADGGPRVSAVLRTAAPEDDSNMLRPFLLLARPEPVAVMAQIPDGPPLRFRWRRVLREVIRAQGPERIAPEWWLGGADDTRDYYRVEDRAGRRYWLYREGLYGGGGGEPPRWFVHGVFG